MTKMSESRLARSSLLTGTLACQAERSSTRGDATVASTPPPIGAACTRADGYQADDQFRPSLGRFHTDRLSRSCRFR